MPYQRGGEEYVVHYLATSLSRLGFEVHVFTSTDSESGGKRGASHTETMKDYVVHYVCTDYIGVMPVKLDDFDIIHIHGFSRLAWLQIFRKYQRKKIILTPHGALTAPYFQKSLLNIMRILFDRIITKNILRKVYRITALTNFEKDFLIKKFGLNSRRIVVIPNGLPEEAFADYKHENMFPYDYIMGLGRIAKIKRYDRIVKILPELPESVHFILVGPDEGEVRNLMKISNRLNVTNRFHYLGPRYGAEKYILLRNALALVISSSFESFPVVSIESLAQGTPVIAPKLPNFSEIIFNEKTGILYQPNSLEELKTAIIRVMEKRQVLKKIIEKSQPRLRDFLWSTIANKVKKVYQID
ncbi:MAG: glycosyltransferase family 4 protein [Candidatus Bathycorpusculaceae bacterium]